MLIVPFVKNQCYGALALAKMPIPVLEFADDI
jgi:hypothetical protein